MDIDEIRRRNIKTLEKQHGPALAKRAGMSPSQFYNLRDGAKDSKTGKPRGMRKETAWKIEDAAGVPRGWLDIDHSQNNQTNEPTSPQDNWPFQMITPKQWGNLPSLLKESIEVQIMALVKTHETEPIRKTA